ncbi:hypothetical protein BBJ28_00023451 [Nothophytophthora sp. Chile5]|nr:hypothetical protein BBJ28_00023451 [Nothophytophthora sp. Chile5]
MVWMQLWIGESKRNGSGKMSAGSLCPVKGSIGVKDCSNKLPSWTNTSTCVAPRDAVCAQIRTGAWGCVFGAPKSSNASTNATTTTAPTTPAPTTTAPIAKPPTSALTTQPPATQPPTTQPYTTQPPITQSPTTQPPSYSTNNKASDITTTHKADGAGATGITAIFVAVGAVIALAGFGLYKQRQRADNAARLSDSVYLGTVPTPV